MMIQILLNWQECREPIIYRQREQLHQEKVE